MIPSSVHAVAPHEIGRRVLQLGDDRPQRGGVGGRLEVADDVDLDAELVDDAASPGGTSCNGGCGRSSRRPWRTTLRTRCRRTRRPATARAARHRRRVLRQRRDVRRRGPRGCPSSRRELGISDAALGLTLVGMGLGGLAASGFSGWLVDRRGSRTMTVTTSAAMSLWLPLLGIAPTAFLVFAALLVLGALDGLTDVSMNAQAVELQRRIPTSIITRFHAVWSAGAVTGGHRRQPRRGGRDLAAHPAARHRRRARRDHARGGALAAARPPPRAARRARRPTPRTPAPGQPGGARSRCSSSAWRSRSPSSRRTTGRR